MKKQIRFIQALIVSFFIPPAFSMPITITDGIAPLPITENFENLRYDQGPSQFAFNAIGSLIGESFEGQTIIGGSGDTKEEIVGLPSLPLRLEIFPGSNDGVYIAELGSQGNTILGLADGIGPDDIGEGTIAVLFDSPQSLFGVTLLGHGSATFQFFSSIGGLIDFETLLVPQKPGQDINHLTISSTGSRIAGFSLIPADDIPTSGISGGFALDDFRLSTIPEPNILLLLLVGLAGLLSSKYKSGT